MTTPPTAPPAWATDWDQDTQDAEWAARKVAKATAAKPTSQGPPSTVVDETAGDQEFVNWLNGPVSAVNETVGWDGPDYTYLLKEAA